MPFKGKREKEKVKKKGTLLPATTTPTKLAKVKKKIQLFSTTTSTPNTTTHLPSSLRKYFWDCRFEELSLEKNDLFIAVRILNFGDWKAVTWLHKNGGIPLIRRTVKNRRDLSAKTINFWQIMLYG